MTNSELHVCSVYSSHSQRGVKDSIHDQILHVYIIYCNIFIPLVLNIIPAIVILILNLTLWFFMKNYTKTISTKQFINETANMSLTMNVRRNITKSQKSHYFTIIILGILGFLFKLFSIFQDGKIQLAFSIIFELRISLKPYSLFWRIKWLQFYKSEFQFYLGVKYFFAFFKSWRIKNDT